MQPLFAIPGPMGMVLILVIVVLLFGANRLPTLFRSLGRSVTEFKKGINEIEDDSETETRAKT